MQFHNNPVTVNFESQCDRSEMNISHSVALALMHCSLWSQDKYVLFMTLDRCSDMNVMYFFLFFFVEFYSVSISIDYRSAFWHVFFSLFVEFFCDKMVCVTSSKVFLVLRGTETIMCILVYVLTSCILHMHIITSCSLVMRREVSVMICWEHCLLMPFSATR